MVYVGAVIASAGPSTEGQQSPTRPKGSKVLQVFAVTQRVYDVFHFIFSRDLERVRKISFSDFSFVGPTSQYGHSLLLTLHRLLRHSGYDIDAIGIFDGFGWGIRSDLYPARRM